MALNLRNILSPIQLKDAKLEAERAALCGPRYAHTVVRQAIRGEHVASSLVRGGRRLR